MRIYVPRAIHAINYGSYVDSYWRGPFTGSPPYRKRIANGVCLPADTILMEGNGYLWDTHGRPMNDCVHTKIVDSEGAEIVPNGILTIGEAEYVYSPHWYSYEERVYASDDMDNNDICTMINGLYVNDNHVSYRIRIYPSWYSGYARFNITVSFYYCAVDQQTYPTVPYFNAVCYMEMSTRQTEVVPFWYTAVPNTVITHLYISGWSGGNSTVRSYVLSLLQETEPVLAAYFSGLTKYYYYRAGRAWYYFSKGCDNLLKDACDLLYKKLQALPAYGRRTKWNKWGFYTYKGVELDYPEPLPPTDRFLFHEDDRIAGGVDPYCLDNTGLQRYWWGVLVQNAYLDTLDSVPRLNDNSISNIIEIAGFIKSLVIDHKIDIPKSLGDAWLSYRYQYTTTKLDVEEAISFMHRHRELGTLDQWIHCFGASHVDFRSGEYSTRVTCRCGLEIRPKDVAMLEKIWRGLYTYGLQPNFYVIWDMIPYSFIADWLLPIGNLMHALDAADMYDGTYYEIKDIVFSVSYEFEDKYANRYHQYSRWVQNDIVQLNGFYFLEEDPVTTKVKGMRILDSLSLFIGRRK